MMRHPSFNLHPPQISDSSIAASSGPPPPPLPAPSMRIRRRPQPSSLLHQQQHYADPSTSAQQTPRNAERSNEEEAARPPHLHANADLGRKPAAARRLALPQDNAVDNPGAEQGGAGDGARRSGLVNGHGGADRKLDVAWAGATNGERAVKVEVEGPVTNGVAAPAVGTSAVKEEKNGSGGAAGGAKKRRGPAVLMEGSRCSRVNGRGWRCSQPTLVGYSLCEHHLGKGRMRSAAAAATAGRGGPGQLGRTEHRAATRMPVGMAVGAVTAATTPKAEEPGLRPY